MKTILLSYVQYNLWANKRIADLLGKTDTRLLHKEIKSSFSTISKTVAHMWGAETIWLSRFTETGLTAFPTAPDDTATLLQSFLSTSESFVRLVDQKDDAFFSLSGTYTDTRGNKHNNQFLDMLMHCMNHSTFHRGQIVTMLREVGETSLPSTDMIAYVREAK